MVFSDKFYIGFSDVGPELKLTNASMLRLFENVCCMQGEAVGDGFYDSDGRWFLTAYHVKVSERPVYNDRVTVSTWSRCMKGVAAAREFEIRSIDGKLLVCALSNWARMNIKTGKLERMTPEAFAKYESEPERFNFEEPWVAKLHGGADSEDVREFWVDRNMIDANRHMNNVFYMELASLVLPDEVYDRGEANEFEITYRKAAAYKDTVLCSLAEDESSRTVTVRQKSTKDVNALIKLYK